MINFSAMCNLLHGQFLHWLCPFGSKANVLTRVQLPFLCSHRNREIRQMRDCIRGGNSFAFLSHDINNLEHSKQAKLPRVTVVMPLKGFGEHNLHNWRTQVSYKTYAT